MTVTLATDARNDIVLTDGGMLSIVSGAAAVEATARSTAQVRRGDMVLAVDQGIPFEQTAWAGVPNVPQYLAQLRARLLALRDVTGIVSLEARQDGNTLRYVAQIRTVYGPVTLNG